MIIILLYQGNPFWRLVRNLLKKPNQEQIDCQRPKPILLDTGEMKEPYNWAVGTQFLSILIGKCCNCRNPKYWLDNPNSTVKPYTQLNF